jgi:hypothetical protein
MQVMLNRLFLKENDEHLAIYQSPQARVAICLLFLQTGMGGHTVRAIAIHTTG